MNGKGSTRRPSQVSDKQVAENWERTFRKRHLTSDDAPEGSSELDRFMYGDRWTDEQIVELNKRLMRETTHQYNRIMRTSMDNLWRDHVRTLGQPIPPPESKP